MSTDDENLYRGDPPPPYGQPGSMPPGYGPPGYGPPGYGQPGSAPPGYGPPGYGPPGYPPPGYGYPYPPVYARPTNTMAILALVMAFVFAPAGLILGIVARKQIRQTGEEGEGLALTGIIIGGIVTAIGVFVFVLWAAAFSAVTSIGFGP